MAPRTTPPFRADHVGSLLRPQKLLEAREQRKANAITAAGADRVSRTRRSATRSSCRRSSGSRPSPTASSAAPSGISTSSSSSQNVTVIPPRIKARFHTHEGDIEFAPPGLRIDGKLARPHGIFVDHFKFVKAATTKPAKQTIPSPSNMHFRGGRGAIDAKAYPDMAGFYADLGRVYSEEVKDLGAAGCRYLQIDEVNFAYLCDPKLREQVKTIGEDPADPAAHLRQAAQRLDRDQARGHGGVDASLPRQFPERVGRRGRLRSRSPKCCSTRSMSTRISSNTTIRARATSSRCATCPRARPSSWASSPASSPRSRARTISSAASTKPRAMRHWTSSALSPQCGFSSTVEGNKITLDDEKRKLRLVVETAREVWG